MNFLLGFLTENCCNGMPCMPNPLQTCSAEASAC
jgi:hypothetical protein